MQHTISQFVRIYSYLFVTIIFYCSVYGSQAPYVPLPNAPDAVSITIPPAQAHLQLPPAEPLSRSVSHGNFQHSQNAKKHKKNKKHKNIPLNQGSAGQRHENSAHTINDYSINVATVAKAKTCNNNRLAVTVIVVSCLLLAETAFLQYSNVTLINKADQIADNTAPIGSIGDQLDSNTAQIAGALNTLDQILELLLNMTKRG